MKTQQMPRVWGLKVDGTETTVTIPHDFMLGRPRRADSPTSADQGYFLPARAEYTTTITASPDATRHFIRFDGVMGLTEVYVNNNLVRFHPYGYTAFTCDVSPYMREGENKVRVVADTTAQSASRWYTGGGIIRNAELLTAGADYICPNSLFIRTNRIYGSKASIQIDWQVYAEKAGTAQVQFTIPECNHTVTRSFWMDEGENQYSIQTMLSDITPWTPDNPQLYTCQAKLTTEAAVDTEEEVFGVRTVECDPNLGFLLNGEPIKLYGACVHHDNGIVGAASFHAAEERRVRILKENGYNCIRCAHNPPSEWMLDACDRLGMMVIDEIFDVWRQGKRNYDYHIWFDRYWQENTDSMVRRDRNHPSIVMWSTGNEIPEKSGVSDGFHIGKMIVDRIRMSDNTRPLTHAFCGFWDNPEYAEKERNGQAPADQMDFYADRIRYSAGSMGVLGYNYMFLRLSDDQIRFPDALFAMTESFPLDAVAIKRYMDSHPRMIGDFVWTGWDYFGETGIGHVEYGVESTNAFSLLPYPNHIADCGDISICGMRKAPSYYREAAWNDNCVRILSADPAKFGQVYGISGWGFHDVHRTWTWPGQEGNMTTVHVYTVADECELWQDGVSLGRKTLSRGIAKYEIPYTPGKLTAVSYRDGQVVGEDVLATTGDFDSLRITVTENSDLIYAEIQLCDKDGNVAWSANDEVTVTAEGAAVLGTGSGQVDTDHVYTEAVCGAYHGQLLAALLPDTADGSVTITVTAGDKKASVVVR